MDNQIKTVNDLTIKKKILYVEMLRIFCIVLVIFNHTSYLGYVYFLNFEPGTLPYWFYMFFTAITGISVPIFFMISGMLLLGKNESIGYIWKRRIPKYVIILAVFSLIFYILDTVIYRREFSIKQFLISIYSEGAIIPYWFLYVYISFLILLPFIRKLARDITEKEFIYLLAIYFVFVSLVRIIQYKIFNGTVTLNPNLNPVIICNIVFFYPLIGYYLGTRLINVTNRMLLVSFGLFVLAVITTMLITDYNLKLTGDYSEETVNELISCTRPFMTIFVFLLARKLFENREFPVATEKAITYIGGCVFGIYLIESAFRENLYFIYYSLCTKTGSFTAIWIYVLLIFLICLLQVAAFRYVVGVFRKNTSKRM